MADTPDINEARYAFWGDSASELATLVAAKAAGTTAATLLGSAPYVPQSGLGYATKRGGYTLGSTNNSRTTTISDWLARYPIRLSQTSTRWRLHVRNYDYRTSGSAAVSGAITCPNGVYIGTPFLVSGVMNGKFTNPLQALASFATDAAGAEYVSPWVTDPTLQFSAHVDYLLSAGFTTAASQSVERDGAGFCFFSSGAGSAANVASTSNSPAATALSLLDVWVEYEYVGAAKVGIWLGTSLPHGYQATYGPHDSYIQQWAQRSNNVAVDAGYSGSTTAFFTTPSDAKWTKFGGVTPDFVVIDLGTNDIQSGTSAATVEANIATIIANAQSTWGATIPIFLCTVPPRRDNTAATETARLAVNKWLRGLPYGVHGCFSLDKAVQDAPARMVVDGATTNTSTTVTSATAVFDANRDTGRVIAGTGIPSGTTISSVTNATTIVLSAAATATATGVTLTIGGPNNLDPEWAYSDGIHILTQGQARMADAIPSRILAAA